MTLSVANQPKQTIIQAVRNYGNRLFHFIRGRVDSDEDAEDILQDVWYQFVNLMNTQPVEQTSAWLYRVARFRIIDRYRKQQPGSLDDLFAEDEEAEEGLHAFVLDGPGSPEMEQQRNHFWQQLKDALDELPEEQKQVFIWNEIEDVSFAAIAKHTGEKVSTLISRKRYAVLHLRKRLGQLYKEFFDQ